MARRLPPAQVQSNEPKAHEEIAGGAPGLIPEAAKEIPELGKATSAAPSEPLKPEEIVRPQRYRVMNTPRPGFEGYPVLYNGVRVQLKQGKIVDSITYDVDYLKRQGVQLDEIQEG
jgi:hypothetical protein